MSSGGFAARAQSAGDRWSASQAASTFQGAGASGFTDNPPVRVNAALNLVPLRGRSNKVEATSTRFDDSSIENIKLACGFRRRGSLLMPIHDVWIVLEPQILWRAVVLDNRWVGERHAEPDTCEPERRAQRLGHRQVGQRTQNTEHRPRLFPVPSEHQPDYHQFSPSPHDSNRTPLNSFVPTSCCYLVGVPDYAAPYNCWLRRVASIESCIRLHRWFRRGGVHAACRWNGNVTDFFALSAFYVGVGDSAY